MTTVKFEKIVGEGKALGYIDGRPCFASGPLPGETAEVLITRDKARFAEGQVAQITQASDMRTGQAEDHYILCSPWQNVEYGYQLELKRKVLVETMGRPELGLSVADMLGADQILGYRNKLEFSVRPDVSGHLALAFHARGSYEDLLVTPEGCRLGSDGMNAAALELVAAAGELKLGKAIHSITVRRSVGGGQLLGIVTLEAPVRADWKTLAVPGLAGVVVARVRHRDSYHMLWHQGETGLVEKVAGLDLAYPYDGFFQTNPPMFERALEQILESVPKGVRLVDLYGGVGTIGLAAARIVGEVVGVEAHEQSVRWATGNADRNGILNYRAVASPAERLDPSVLRGAGCVVVDPPRAGLHPQVVESLLEAAPARIIYLSCNPATQARDLMVLGSAYKSGPVAGFDFYPGTLHMESLAILDRT
ncbi:MAG TPA: TRAM domain-containing protein [Candidatus Saccharimonadia bacterium]|nr:TRAM domain-containing protein [Candidatus Saccharimonadia bacterium]